MVHVVLPYWDVNNGMLKSKDYNPLHLLLKSALLVSYVQLVVVLLLRSTVQLYLPVLKLDHYDVGMALA